MFDSYSIDPLLKVVRVMMNDFVNYNVNLNFL